MGKSSKQKRSKKKSKKKSHKKSEFGSEPGLNISGCIVCFTDNLTVAMCVDLSDSSFDYGKSNDEEEADVRTDRYAVNAQHFQDKHPKYLQYLDGIADNKRKVLKVCSFP
jgi:hypothetical protein